MPSLPKRPCSYPGCEVPVSSGRCEGHQRAKVEERKTPTERGYGAEHQRLRVLCFERDSFTCVDCGWMPAGVRVLNEAKLSLTDHTAGILAELKAAFHRGERHLHADHDIPIEVDASRQHDLTNYRTRCNECHAAKTAREDGGFGNSWTSKIRRETMRNREQKPHEEREFDTSIGKRSWRVGVVRIAGR